MLWFVTLAIKSTAIMTIAWIVAYALRSRSAAARHLVWTGAAAAVLALPLLSISLPSIAVPAIPLDAGVLFTATAGARAEANATPLPQRSGAANPAPRASWLRAGTAAQSAINVTSESVRRRIRNIQ